MQTQPCLHNRDVAIRSTYKFWSINAKKHSRSASCLWANVGQQPKSTTTMRITMARFSMHPCSQSSYPPLKGRLRQMKPLMRSVFVQITTVMVPEIPTDRKTDKNWLFVLRFKVKLTDGLINIHRSLFHPSSIAVYSWAEMRWYSIAFACGAIYEL